MKRISIPQPPNPDAGQYSSQVAFNRAMHDWAVRVKGIVEDGWRINSAPCGQAMLATSFTTATVAQSVNAVVQIGGVATGTATVTATVTDVASAKVLASLIQALTDKGILSPSVSRSATQ